MRTLWTATLLAVFCLLVPLVFLLDLPDARRRSRYRRRYTRPVEARLAPHVLPSKRTVEA